MLEYETLRLIWWGLMGFLLAGFVVMDGFDLGVAMLLPVVGRQDVERRIMLNTIGPVWEGNQVWFILGGGSIFAAWPYLYAVSFSGFYLAILLLLLTFILRPVSFKYRSKLSNTRWRSTWDWVLCLSGWVAALVFGVAVGNTLEGVPFYFDADLRSFYTGSIWELFNPFGIFCGLLSIAMLQMHGAHYLVVKTEGLVRARAIRSANIAALAVIVLFALGGLWIQKGIKGYMLLELLNPNGVTNPLHHDVVQKVGAWLNNYYREPSLLCIPFSVFLFALCATVLVRWGSGKIAFVCSSMSVFFIVVTVGISMFPFILPSSIQPGSSLMVWTASASQLSLMIMLGATIFFMPIILCYTAWVYRVLRGPVTEEMIRKDSVKDKSAY